MEVLNWRMIATVIILLAIIAVALSMHPAISDFVQNIFKRMAGYAPEEPPDRNISFILTSDKYVNLDFSNQNINIMLSSDDFQAELGSGILRTDKNVSIVGVGMFGYVNGTKIFFEGEFSKIDVEGTLLSFNTSTIKANSTFNTLLIENLAMDRLDLPAASGTIIFDDAMITMAYKDSNITYSLASYNFSSQLHVEGIAEQIIAENIIIGP